MRLALRRLASRAASAFTLLDRLFALRQRYGRSPGPDARRARPELAALEDRVVLDGRPLPCPIIYTGTGEGPPPLVRAFDAVTGQLNFERTVADPSFAGGVRVATADFTRDGFPDLAVALGPTGEPRVQVLDGKTGQPVAGPLGSFLAYHESFRGGLEVAAADADGDGTPDVITAAGAGGGPHVQAFSGRTGELIRSFFAFDPDFRGGVSVAAADFDGDGRADLAVGAGAGGGPRVRVFDLTTTQQLAGPLGNFFAFDPDFRGGVSVGADSRAGDVDADGTPDLVVGTGPGAASRVKVFSGRNGRVLADFAPFAADMTAGVRVATAYVDDDGFADVVTGTGPGVPATVRVFSGRTLRPVDLPTAEFLPFGPGATGGVSLAASNDPPDVTVGMNHGADQEGSSSGTYFRLDLAQTSPDPVTVTYTVGGTATGGTDYTGLSGGSATIPAGSGTAFLEFDLVDDALVEGDETIVVTITAVTGGTIGTPSSQTFTIVDDEPPASPPPPPPPPQTVTVQRAGDGEEPGTNGGFVLRRSGDPAQLQSPLTVSLAAGGTATAGADYAALPPSITFPAGQAEYALPVLVLDDEQPEGRETVTATLSAGAGYAVGTPGGDATVTILDDEVRAVDDQTGVPAGGSVAVAPLGNDTGLTAVTAVGTPAHGTVTLSGNTVTYTPNAGFTGQDRFTYTATGPAGVPDTATVTVDVGALVPAPTVFTGCECSCGCPDQPGSEAKQAPGSGGSGPSPLSRVPVRYSDGVARVAATDLASEGLGGFWGLTRSWTADTGADDPKAAFGNGVAVTQLPRLAAEPDGSRVAVVLNGTHALTFDRAAGGDYAALGPGADRLAADAAAGEFRLTDPAGQVFRFYDFAASRPEGQRGRLAEIRGAAGDVTAAAYLPDGRVDYVERSAAVGGAALAERQAFAYVAAGFNAGKVASVTLRRRDAAGAWHDVRSVAYDYYAPRDAHGTPGDLRSATTADPAGHVVGEWHYRYYGFGEAGGFAGGLKYVLSGPSLDRVRAEVGDPRWAADAELAPFADRYFEYDAQRRVTLQRAGGAGCSACAGGQGEFTFAYDASGNAPGVNAWAAKTVETLPDGNQNVVFTNYLGQVLLRAFREASTGREWVSYYRYDAAGRLVLEADPSAVTGYDVTLPDLVGLSGGNAPHLRDGEGLVTAYAYYPTTTATGSSAGGAAGYLEGVAVRRGELGAEVPQSHVAYIARTAGGVTTYPVASETGYRNDDGTGAVTVTTAYTFVPDTTRVASVAVTLPAVSAAENGPGTAATVTAVLDALGRPAWTRDPAGVLTYAQFDPATGAVVKLIEDVDTTRAGEFAGLPAGWSTPAGAGLHRVTTAEADALGRATKVVSPGGRVDYVVYDDAAHEARYYAGWDAATGRPTGPTVVTREDHARGYIETLTMTATPAVDGSGRPTGAEAIAGLRSLTRERANRAGQVVAVDEYFDLAGLAYSAAPTLGAEGVNYYRTEYGYDKQGRPSKVVTPAGTIYRTVYDGQGRVASEWVGDDDTPASGWWSPTNPAGMVKVREYEYDGGGVGDGALTKLTEIPGGGAADRVTVLGWDWRGRPVAAKQGAGAWPWYESADVNRPLAYAEYDNLGNLTRVRVYDGDGVGIADADADGVPDAPAAGLLRARVDAAYDALGRAYRVDEYGVDQQTGAVGATPLTARTWFDPRGQVVKTAAPGGLVEKVSYDSLGRPTAAYQTDGGGDAAWADALSVAGDVVLSQAEFGYDGAGDLVQVTTRERAHGETGTGGLGTAATGVRARVSSAGWYYDALGRVTAAVDVGTNGGAAWSRPSAVPARSDTELVTSYGYDDAGNPFQVTGPDGVTTRSAFDALGRVTSYTAAYGTADALTASYAYDSFGRLLSETAPGGRVTRYAYDSFSRISGVTERYGTALARTTQLGYDNLGAVTTVTDPLGAVTRTAYDVLGRVASVTEADGTSLARTTALAYDALGRVTSATDPRSYTSTLTYDDVARTVTAADPLGNAWTAAYDDAGNQVSVIDPYEKAWTTSYDLLGRPVSAADPLGNTTAFEYNVTADRDAVVDPRTYRTEAVYDRFGRTSSVVDALGNSTAFAYDRAGRVVTATDGRGTPSAFAYDNLGRVRVATEAVGYAEQRSTQYGYDPATGDLATVTDPRGTVTRYGYDAAGRVTSVTAGDGLPVALSTGYGYDLLDRVTSVTTPGGRRTEYGYDGLGQLRTVTEGAGTSLARTRSFDYDPAGNLLTATDPLGRVTGYAYDQAGRLTAVTEAVGTSVERSTGYAYDKAGRVVTVTDPRGNATAYGYDDAGRRTSVTNALDQTTAFAYDKAGNLTSVTDPLNHTTAFAYDKLNRLASVTDALNHTTAYGYDANGNLVTVTDPRNNTTTYGYDRLDRPTSVTNALNETTSFGYDANGNQVSVTNARSAVWGYGYDALNRLTSATDPVTNTTTLAYDPATGDLSKVTDPLGKSVAYGYDALGRRVTVTARTGGTTTTAYDAADRVVSVTDPLTHATAYGYDDLDRVVSVTDPRSQATSFGYDPNDNLVWVEDAALNKTQFAYDKLNRVTAETDPLGKVTATAYDAAGRRVSVTDRLGRVREWGYDIANRVTSETWKTAGGSVVQVQAFGYDAAGNLTGATDPDGSYALAYDALNRPVTVEEPFGLTLTFGYDAAGNRTSVADNKGATQTSEYDLANRLTSRRLDTPAGDARVDYAYTARGQVDTVTRYADLAGTTKAGTTAYGYDDGGRTTGIVHKDAAGGVVAEYGYAYDLADRLTSKTENGLTTGYGYDAADQLTADGATGFAYDGTGNRTGGTSIGPGNRLLSDGTWAYTYDDAGQLVKKSKGAGAETWTYSYDHDGQLVSATQSATDGGSATATVSYSYDAFGNRLGRTGSDGTGTSTEKFAYDGWDTAKPAPVGNESFDVWADLDGSGAVTARRLSGPGFDDHTARVSAGGAVGWYATDLIGSVRAVLDNSGSVTASATYDAFGNLTAGSLSDRYGYAGREWDGALGAYHNRARVYDPSTGRFTTEDPLGLAAGDANLSRYVGNQPTTNTDPSGRWLYAASREEAERTVAFLASLGISASYEKIDWGWAGRAEYVILMNPEAVAALRRLADQRPDLWSSEFARTETVRALGSEEHVWFSANGGRFYTGETGDYPPVDAAEKRRINRLLEPPPDVSPKAGPDELPGARRVDPILEKPPTPTLSGREDDQSRGADNGEAFVAGAIVIASPAVGQYVIYQGGRYVLVEGGRLAVQGGRVVVQGGRRAVIQGTERLRELLGRGIVYRDALAEAVRDQIRRLPPLVGGTITAFVRTFTGLDPCQDSPGPVPRLPSGPGTAPGGGARPPGGTTPAGGVRPPGGQAPGVRGMNPGGPSVPPPPPGSGSGGAGTSPNPGGTSPPPPSTAPNTPTPQPGTPPTQSPGAGTPPSLPPIMKDEHHRLTNGLYKLDEKGMIPHTTGSLKGGKSQFLSSVNEKKLVLDAAAIADQNGLWVGNKAKVTFSEPIGVHAGTGELTCTVNIYRKDTGFVHGSPGSP